MANSLDPDQTDPIGAVCSGSTLFSSIHNSSVMLGNYLQQMTSADNIFRCIFFLGLKPFSCQLQLFQVGGYHKCKNAFECAIKPNIRDFEGFMMIHIQNMWKSNTNISNSNFGRDYIWASLRENLSSGVCEQQRCRAV